LTAAKERVSYQPGQQAAVRRRWPGMLCRSYAGALIRSHVLCGYEKRSMRYAQCRDVFPGVATNRRLNLTRARALNGRDAGSIGLNIRLSSVAGMPRRGAHWNECMRGKSEGPFDHLVLTGNDSVVTMGMFGIRCASNINCIALTPPFQDASQRSGTNPGLHGVSGSAKMNGTRDRRSASRNVLRESQKKLVNAE
jgi:hypothetical protein